MRSTGKARWLRGYPCIYRPAGYRAIVKRRAAVLPRRLCRRAALARREDLRSLRQNGPGHYGGRSSIWMLAEFRHEGRVAILAQARGPR